MNRRGSAQLANTLGSLANSQVARTAFTMLSLAGCGQSKSLLGSLVSLLLRHFQTD